MTSMTNSGELFDRGLDFFGDAVAAMQPGDWDRLSPCDGWTALDVLGHLGSSIQMGISLFRGEQPVWPQVERPAELVAGDPAAFWKATATEARSAMEGADLDLVMDTPMGPRTVADRLAFPAIDLFVHAWDLAQTQGRALEVPADLITFARSYIDALPPEAVRSSGALGPVVEVGDDATATERFIGWTGRDPRSGHR